MAVLGPSASPASNSIISNICGEKEVSAGSASSISNSAVTSCVTEQSFISLPILEPHAVLESHPNPADMGQTL